MYQDLKTIEPDLRLRRADWFANKVPEITSMVLETRGPMDCMSVICVPYSGEVKGVVPFLWLQRFGVLFFISYWKPSLLDGREGYIVKPIVGLGVYLIWLSDEASLI